jgi:hypothetical protein
METVQKALRRQVLKMLYAARVKDPEAGYVYGRDFNDALGECEFALAVLAEIGHVKRDGHRYQITGNGVLAFEED